VRSLFLHRRKLLRIVLATVLKGQLRKFQIDEILAQVELGAQTRAEELDVPKVIELFGAVRAATSAST
jgi:16S rRNA A1518/A1519 N6-dimethyltransferase RsmA/KsgA/DIM1 with predicted DNA glycosylase/AP lyase activity